MVSARLRGLFAADVSDAASCESSLKSWRLHGIDIRVGFLPILVNMEKVFHVAFRCYLHHCFLEVSDLGTMGRIQQV